MTTIDEERSVVIFGGGTSRVCVCEQSTVERLILRPPCPCSLSSSSSSLVCGSRSVLGVYFIFVSRRSSRRGGEEEVAADVDKDKEGEDGEVEGEEDEEEEEEESQEATTVGEEEKESLLLLLSLEWSGEEDTEVAVAR